VGRRYQLLALLAMFMSRVGVILRLFVLAQIMMKGGLMMVMRGRAVMSGGPMVMLTGFDFAMALFLSQPVVEKLVAGCSFDMVRLLLPAAIGSRHERLTKLVGPTKRPRAWGRRRGKQGARLA
jgi:hypothetical protein